MNVLTSLFLSEKNRALQASVILAIIIMGVYAPIVFLDQSLNQSYSIPPNLSGYSVKLSPFTTNLDPLSAGDYIAPKIKLITQLYLQGKLPLWDPYVGIGRPLAADIGTFAYDPIMIFYFLPSTYWDVPLLIGLWIAGISTFLFLRKIGLNFVSSISGGIFYMLSGSLLWYLPHLTVNVMIFTPLILYSLERLIQTRNKNNIVLTSLCISFSILGFHPESLILQLLLVGSYLSFRLILGLFSQRKSANIHYSNNHIPSDDVEKRRVLLWAIFGFLGALGLTAFFTMPVYDFLIHSDVPRSGLEGSYYRQPYAVLSGFVPYVLGGINDYWNTQIAGEQAWYSLWGYVGIFNLFFSILAVSYCIKNNTTSRLHRCLPIFFFAFSIFFIMKNFGVPIVNLIGYAPFLNNVDFTRYTAVLVPFGFAVSGAFGINLLSNGKIKFKNLALSLVIVISSILLLSLTLIPYLFSNKAISYHGVNPVYYVGFQILQTLSFSFLAFFSSYVIWKNASKIILVPLLVLELSLYVPLGLNPLWLIYKFLAIVMIISIIIIVLKLSNRSQDLKIKKTQYLILALLVIGFTTEVIISEHASHVDLKHDSYPETSLTNYLKENLGNSRMFSLDYVLSPNYPGAYQISTIGSFSAYSEKSFQSFYLNFLDQNAWHGVFGFPPWVDRYGQDSFEKFYDNKKYFDFLGVKYILTKNYDLNDSKISVPYARIPSSDDNLGQTFTSPTGKIDGIGISIGRSNSENKGNLILTLDSIPYESKYHRTSVLDVTKMNSGTFFIFKFSPSLLDAENKKFHFSINYPVPQSPDMNNISVALYEKNSSSYNKMIEKYQGQFYVDKTLVKDKQMIFSIINFENPLPFDFSSISVNENKEVFPRAFLVNKFVNVETNKAQEFLLQNPNFDLRHDVILEKSLTKNEIDLLGSSKTDNDMAEISYYSENNVKIKTNSTNASLLLLTDAYYPGWKSLIDGKESEIYKADGLVRAVFVPAGNHTIEFSYFPQSFVMGVIVSVCTASVLVFLLMYSRIKHLAIIHKIPKV